MQIILHLHNIYNYNEKAIIFPLFSNLIAFVYTL